MGGGPIGGRPAAALLARGVSKRYGGTRALDGAGVEVLPGEVHALLGRNGSGKSTLVRILSGAEAPEPGAEIARAGRVGVVHQDLALIPALSVTENLRLTSLARRRGARISWREERRRAAAAMGRLGVALDPAARVADLSPVERVQLAVARALDDLEGAPEGAAALVLDEPTAGLPGDEARRLLELVRAVAAAGAAVLLVTHDLSEALAGDRVTVLRDGRVAAVLAAREASEERLEELILGEPRRSPGPRPAGARGRVAASVRGLAGERLRGLDLDLRAGEIVGLTGAPGSGWEEVLYLVAGARRAAAGVLELAGERLELAAMTPARAVAAGVVLIPSDRLGDGCAGPLSAADNVTLPRLGRLVRRLRLDRRRLAADARAALASAGVRPADPAVRFATLSGGNQQRALLAKWLAGAPRLVLADEPVQGIDVGGRPAALALLRAAADAGAAVLCASGDPGVLRALCDRLVVVGAAR